MAASKTAIAFQLSLVSPIVYVPKRPKAKWVFSARLCPGKLHLFSYPSGALFTVIYSKWGITLSALFSKENSSFGNNGDVIN